MRTKSKVKNRSRVHIKRVKAARKRRLRPRAQTAVSRVRNRVRSAARRKRK